MPADFFALSNLKMIYDHREKKISLIPDDLSRRYTEFPFLFSPNTLTWLFSLVTLFFISCLSSFRK